MLSSCLQNKWEVKSRYFPTTATDLFLLWGEEQLLTSKAIKRVEAEEGELLPNFWWKLIHALVLKQKLIQHRFSEWSLDCKAGLKTGERQVWPEKQKQQVTQLLWHKIPLIYRNVAQTYVGSNSNSSCTFITEYTFMKITHI